MFKRIGLLLLTNIAILAVLALFISITQAVFGINIAAYGADFTGVMIFSAILGFGGAFVSLFMSKWSAKKIYKIKPITKDEISGLGEKESVVYRVVEELAERNHIKMPEVGIYLDAEPNAFATGSSKNSSLVAVSSGLLTIMSKEEIEGVVGHEMAHILNGDMVTMTLLQGVLNTFVIAASRILANIFDNITDGKFGFLGYFVISMILQIIFGLLASLIAMKFSRYREYRADAGSAQFVGKSKMIAGLRALQKMQSMAKGDNEKLATMKISTKNKGGIMSLFSSHPDLEDRIQKLEELSI